MPPVAGRPEVSAVSVLLPEDGRTCRRRPATSDDAPGTTDLVNVVGAEGSYILWGRATWTREEEQRTLGGAEGVAGAFFVAEVDDLLAGMIRLLRGKWP
jgi:hypothetical protein